MTKREETLKLDSEPKAGEKLPWHAPQARQFEVAGVTAAIAGGGADGNGCAS